MKAERNLEMGTRAPFVKLVTSGRVTGLPHIVLVRFVMDDGAFYVLGGKEGGDWMLNSLASGGVKVRVGEMVYRASASPLSPEDRTRALGLFEQKYGARVVRDWYAASTSGLKLRVAGEPTVRGAARGEADVRTGVDEWRAKNSDYYEGVATAFDSASEEYDYTIRHNFINMWIRRRSIEELLSLVRHEDVLVEVGCGTGAEAIEISKHVSGIVATDISKKMIALVRRKVGAMKLGHKILWAQVRASEIGQVAGYLHEGGTRVAYSFNGALNCEPDMVRFPAELSKIMVDGGYFVCSVRNTLCLSEALSHAMVMQFGKMAPRKRQPIMVSVGGIDIPSNYYPPSRFASFFLPYFDLRRMVALPAILPPAYLSDIYVRSRRLLSFLERLDKGLSSRFPFNRLGDQTLFVFQKRAASD